MTLRIIVMGVAGCGKSSVGEAVADAIGAFYVDGDDLHPAANIKKMSAGHPLTDEDRAPWLGQVGRRFKDTPDDLLIGCSALKRDYRNQIRVAAGEAVWFLHLSGSRAVIEGRMSQREGHFMPVSLLDSQFAALEPLQSDELGAAVEIGQNFDGVVADSVKAIKSA